MPFSFLFAKAAEKYVRRPDELKRYRYEKSGEDTLAMMEREKKHVAPEILRLTEAQMR